MSEFKSGDVVQLKSGGPKMTIATFLSPSGLSVEQVTDRVHCIWFVNGMRQCESFPLNSLKMYEPKETSPLMDAKPR